MDDSSMIWPIAIVILVALSAFFSATETAFSSISKARLKNYANSGDKRAKRALKVADRYDTALSAVLIGNNIVNIGAASVGTLLFTGLMGPSGAGVSTIVLTIVVLIFGEVVPKSLAKMHPENMAMRAATPLWYMMKLFYPLIWVLQRIVKLFSRKMSTAQPSVTEEELKVIIEEIEDEGVLNEHESELVQSAIDFDDITAEEILTPRVDVIAVEVTENPETIKDLFFATGFSRLPVYRKSVDDVVGVINQKDFIRVYLQNPQVDITSLMQRVVFIPPKKRISKLMRELQHEHVHIAVVTDSYGGTIGIVTLEDIVEELVGEIWDESDQVTIAFEKLSGEPEELAGTYRVSGDMNVYDLLDLLKVSEEAYTGSSQSLSGWALDRFERIPEVGESFSYENLHIAVETVHEQRITSFLVTADPVSEEDDDD